MKFDPNCVVLFRHDQRSQAVAMFNAHKDTTCAVFVYDEHGVVEGCGHLHLRVASGRLIHKAGIEAASHIASTHGVRDHIVVSYCRDHEIEAIVACLDVAEAAI